VLYDIKVRTSYEYESPVGGARHILRLMPANLPGEQCVVSASLEISPEPRERSVFEDFFGNEAIEALISAPHTRFESMLIARVERLPRAVPHDVSPRADQLEPAFAAGFGSGSPLHYAAESPLIRLQSVMTDYARAQFPAHATVFEAACALNLALHRDFRFDPAATTVETPPIEAFTRRRGVCQDFSHIMISCLRGVGIPAAYVSGYLRTAPAPGQERLEGADAMHAWVRAWCGESMGWVEFDPTNALIVGADHIVAAHGRDYSDVAPIKGVLRAGGAQDSMQAVDVLEVA
jgi:transglutaminase-like putative cysteine protease